MKKTAFIFFAICVFASCKDIVTETTLDAPPLPENPFSSIDYNPDTAENTTPDSTTFLGLHQHVFSQSCNQPGCHDGSFEPDFRTVQSSYNTLVLHPVKKNFEVDPMPFRVTPGSPEMSMMWKRLTEHNPPNFERMPSSGETLSPQVLDNIKSWITDGAKDIFGNLPDPESSQANCYGLMAFLPELNNFRVDSIRGGQVTNPFAVVKDRAVKIWFTFVDNDAFGNPSFGENLAFNKVKLSMDRFDFSDAPEFDLEVAASPLVRNIAFSNYNQTEMFYYHNFSFKPADLGYEVGDIVYLRTYVQDEDHELPYEQPIDETVFYLKSYFSFYVAQ